MPRGDLSPDEEAAGNIVAAQVGGTPVARDVLGAQDRTHDLDIELPDGRCIALEVTSPADPELVSMRAAAGKPWPAPSLSASWWISYVSRPPVSIKTMMRGLAAHLKVLEE